MPGNLHLFVGNHLETLVGALAQATAGDLPSGPADPLRPEVVLVQSKGMQRWISMSLARHNGICANMAFPFPNAFLEGTYAKAIGPLPDPDPFDPQRLTFRIMTLLKEMIEKKGFGPIRNYLSGRDSDVKRLQLSKRIADLFDQYLVFRPEIILAWDRGQGAQLPEGQAWQALLWQRIRSDVQTPHRAEIQKQLIQKLADKQVPIQNLPARVSVFGISYLPLFHLQILDALAHQVPVNLFLLNPCRQYWTDIFSDHQLARIRSRVTGVGIDPAALHLERGNRLLSSWGHQGRQFFGLTQHLEGQVTELFRDNSGRTLLERIQQDILDLVDRSGELNSEHLPPATEDGSIRVHACHSPMREVEVLHDQLLDIFDGDPQIHPGDILVMTPDIGEYGPYIHAVFGSTGQRTARSIPYTVADQNIAGESMIVEGYLRLLQFRESRFEVSRVMQLLAYDALRQKFRLRQDELHQVETWLREANIRWGWDGEYLLRHGLPRSEVNTWRSGLDRLIAGYAMLAKTDDLFAGLRPHEGIEGGDAQTLGKFIHFVETLYHRVSQIPEKATLDRWAAILTDFIDTFFHQDQNLSRDMKYLRASIGRLDEIAGDIPVREEIKYEVVHQYLADDLKQTSYGTGFMAGSVTFCAMLPMRSIPAKVVCLLGLQHDAFPREQRDPGFSIIGSDPQPGDRSKRNDDKYLFLEALLSARNIFYISYIGRDIQDNSEKPPSVLVSELLEYIDQGYGITTRRLLTEHPLQPFSPAYFDGHDPRLFSYSKENRDALRHMTSARGRAPFFCEALPPPEDLWRQCDLGQLIAFFANPIRFLMQRRLGIYLGEEPDVFEDRERFNLDALARFQLGQSLLTFRQLGSSAADHFNTAVGAGDLPPGTAGRVVHDDILDEVNRFLHTLRNLWPEDEPKAVDLDLDLTPYRISGRIDGIFSQVRVASRLGRLRPKDLLSAFISHLAMNVMLSNHRPKKSLLICKDAVWEFNPIEPSGARETLKTYLSIYWDGLQKPAAFFSLTSFEYAFALLVKHRQQREALTEAFKKWRGGYYQKGESQDPYINLGFKDDNPLTEDFESTALTVFRPIFEAGRELRTSV